MATPKPTAPEAAEDQQGHEVPAQQEPGTNAVQHEPDPSAERAPDADSRYIKRSPYTTGNY